MLGCRVWSSSLNNRQLVKSFFMRCSWKGILGAVSSRWEVLSLCTKAGYTVFCKCFNMCTEAHEQLKQGVIVTHVCFWALLHTYRIEIPGGLGLRHIGLLISTPVIPMKIWAHYQATTQNSRWINWRAKDYQIIKALKYRWLYLWNLDIGKL